MTVDDKELEQTGKDSFFEPRRVPYSDNVRQLIRETQAEVESFEVENGIRKRRRKPDDQVIFEAMVTAILCNLIHHHQRGLGGGVAITRSHRTLAMANRYRHPALSAALPPLLDTMARPELGLIEQEIGYVEDGSPKKKRTTIKATDRLIDSIRQLSIREEDLTVEPHRETVVLKRDKFDYWDRGSEINYREEDLPAHMRPQLNEINNWLAAANLSVEALKIDTDNRQLRRIFTRGNFESGGRLFGGFWQQMTKVKRKGIRIDGEGVVTIDYSQLNPRILYGMVGAEPPSTDLYNIAGLEGARAGIKKVFNAIMFSEKRLTRFPRETRQYFPTRVKIEDALQLIELAHPPLRDLFYTDIGHRAQFIESEIMVDLLLSLKREGIVGLPIHDAVAVPHSKKERTKGMMMTIFKRHAHVDGLVEEE